MRMQMDIREFRLGKWYIPKESLSISVDNTGYHALGYFDIIEVGAPVKEEVLHPWRQAYNSSCRLDTELQSDYFVQGIKAFTNISEDKNIGFTEENIQDFWKEDTLLLCMSMLRVSLETDIASLIQQLNSLFKGKRYLYYYSFDYSGVIVVAKDVAIPDYLDRVLKIKCQMGEKGPIVKDTYSMYGLQRTIYNQEVEQWQASTLPIEKNKIQVPSSDFKGYEIAVNISVSSYSEYKEFENDFRAFEEKNNYQSKIYMIPGRHDVSIVNEEADLYWLLNMQHLLDQYSTEKTNAFYSYETFVKMPHQSVECQEDDGKVMDEAYQDISKKLEVVYQEFENEFGKDYLSYQTPVREVCNSVLSILRNAFAEDFVLCMYQAFWGFLRYLINKWKTKEDDMQYKIHFEKCFIQFFDGLSSLANSAMHTDRQFTQPTSFNAIFYDVPPKIMAFYVAMIHKICGAMSLEDNYKYIFLMKPGFSDEINNEIISFSSEEAEDRIWQISINERFLYHPEAVMRRIAHEIAHVKGDGLRLRETRKERILYTYLFTILRECLPIQLPDDDEFLLLLNNIYEYLTHLPQMASNQYNYSHHVQKLSSQVLRLMIDNKKIRNMVKQYIVQTIERMNKNGKLSKFVDVVKDETKDSGLSVIEVEKIEMCSYVQMEYLAEVLFESTINRMKELWRGEITKKLEYTDGILNGQPLGQYAHILISLYSETYADIQMIQIVNMSYEKYLEGFVQDEKLDVDNFEKNNEDISRIAVVAELMWEEGRWNRIIDERLDSNLQKVHRKIVEFVQEARRQDSQYYMQNDELRQYLYTCLEKSKAHYAEQEGKIKDIQDNIDVIIKHDDVQKVYETINKVLREYKDYLREMTWENFQ